MLLVRLIREHTFPAVLILALAIAGGAAPIASAADNPLVIDNFSGTTVGTRVYIAPGPIGLHCMATPDLAGLAAPCRLTLHRTATAVTYRATVADKAGHVTTVTGRYRLSDYVISGAPMIAGRYAVTVGHYYTIKVYAAGKQTPMFESPQYAYASPAGKRPGPGTAPMYMVSSHLYEIRVFISPAMKHHARWTLGFVTGGKLYRVPILVRG